jgi:hypothetical protein
MKHNLIKKILIPILTLAIFLMPISPSFEQKNALAQYEGYQNLLPDSTLVRNSISETNVMLDFAIKGVEEDWHKIYYYSFYRPWPLSPLYSVHENGVVIAVMENNNYVSHYDLSGEVFLYSTETGGVVGGDTRVGPLNLEKTVSIGNLEPGKIYTAGFYAQVNPGSPGTGGGINLFPDNTKKDFYSFGQSLSFTTTEEGGINTIGDMPKGISGIAPLSLDCSLTGTNVRGNYLDGVLGCVAGLFYTIWEITAMIASFAGRFLDFFVYYSTNGDSYTSGFIDAGWSGIRDVANIFFIIALLFVAIKTILGLDVTNNKKIIGYVIIFALLINFSLFTTKVVIDTSNILAKVFYNNITSVDSNGQAKSNSGGGEKSISVGLVKKFNPQEIISQQKDYFESRGRFIFITILLILITLYTAYIFFSIAILFVSRVVSLWLSMIFSPIAFVSYTLPFEIPGFGHKEWWKDLLKNAFLAPIFIFFLYIIVMFSGFLTDIIEYPDSADFMVKTMSKIIPFVILAVLLMKSKEIAIKFSGEMGQGIMKGAAVIGGLALGGASMGVAAVGRGTIGAFMKGASTGESANQRFARSQVAGAHNEMRGTWDTIKGAIGHYGTGTLLTTLQQRAGRTLNENQHDLAHAAHARGDLDKVAGEVAHGKKWNELNGDERYEARRKLARDRTVRENSGTTGLSLGTRKWDSLTQVE